MIKVTITAKSDHLKVSESEIFYQPLMLTLDNETLKEKVQQVVDRLGLNSMEEGPEIKVVAKMDWQK